MNETSAKENRLNIRCDNHTRQMLNKAAAFYRHFGFIELPGKPDRLLLPAAAFCR